MLEFCSSGFSCHEGEIANVSVAQMFFFPLRSFDRPDSYGNALQSECSINASATIIPSSGCIPRFLRRATVCDITFGNIVNNLLDMLHHEHIIFFHTTFCRDWISVSCFTMQFPGIGAVCMRASLHMCKVQRQSPLANQAEDGTAVSGSEEVSKGWGFAIEIAMGRVFKSEAGCKCCKRRVCEESCPS